jgi:phage gp45-like
VSNPTLANLTAYSSLGESGLPELQVEAMANEVYDGVMYFTPCGLYGVPHSDSDLMLVPLNGGRSLAAGFVDDIRNNIEALNALNLQAGESVLYAQGGSQIVMRLGGIIEVIAPTSLVFTTPSFTVNSTSIDLNGSLNFNGSPYLNHRHTGVQTGASTSGVVS